MDDPLLEDLARLHQAIHAQDPAPANERERQAAHIFAGVQQILLALILDHNVGLRTLELALLYTWLRLAILNRGYDEDHCSRFAADLGMVMERLVRELKALEAELEDEGPSAAMAELGGKIELLRALAGSLDQADFPRAEIERQTAKTTEALFRFTADCLQEELHPGLLESAMLYYWLRASTLTASVPEPFFQKLERQWPTVVERVGAMMDRMLTE